MAVIVAACSEDDDGTGQNPPSAEAITFTEADNSGGCADFVFYHYSDDREYGLELVGDSDSLVLTTDWQDFVIGQTDSDDLQLTLYAFSQPLNSFFCDDVIEAGEDPLQEWEAEAGTVRLRRTEADDNGLYTIDVVLSNVVVNRQEIARIERSGVEVGWFPG